MLWSEYEKMTIRTLKGRKVRINRPIYNGYMRIPEGTIATIERKLKGFKLVSEPCPHCGVSLYIDKVEPPAVDLLPLEEENDSDE